MRKRVLKVIQAAGDKGSTGDANKGSKGNTG